MLSLSLLYKWGPVMAISITWCTTKWESWIWNHQPTLTSNLYLSGTTKRSRNRGVLSSHRPQPVLRLLAGESVKKKVSYKKVLIILNPFLKPKEFLRFDYLKGRRRDFSPNLHKCWWCISFTSMQTYVNDKARYTFHSILIDVRIRNNWSNG